MLSSIPKDTIVIVGNGFDVAHGLSSSYTGYKEWLQEHNMSLYDALMSYIDLSGNWWNEFEKNLAAFHVPKLIHDAPRENVTQAPLFHPSIPLPAKGYFRNIREQISKSFTEWVDSLSTASAKPTVNMPKADLYISFNYTDTLERVYGIPESLILYLHGKAARGDELVFGHNKSHFEIEEMIKKKYNLQESESFLVPGSFGEDEYQLALEISFLDKSPYTQIVKFKDLLIPAVVHTKIVWAFGLSFSEVDFEYIEWIAQRNRDLFWQVSWHKERDKVQIIDTFKALGVRNYELFNA